MDSSEDDAVRDAVEPSHSAAPNQQEEVALLQQQVLDLKSELLEYQDLYENAPDMFASISAESKCVIRCNQTLAHRLAYDKNDIIGMHVTELYTADSQDAVRTALEQFVEHGKVEDAQLRLRCKNGEGIPVSLNVSAVKDEFGRTLYSRSIWRDATKRREVEFDAEERNASLTTANEILKDKYQSAEDLFTSLFHYAGMGIALVSPEGKVFESNKALHNILGYTAEELENKSFVEFTHPDDVEIDWGLYKELIEGKRNSYNMDKRYIHSSGKIIFGRLTVSLIHDPKSETPFAIGMVEDVTEQHHVEEKLRESQRRFELAIEGAADGIWDYQPDSGAIVVSKRLLSMLGIAKDKRDADLAFWCQFIHQLDRPVLEEVFVQALKDRKRFSAECRLLHADGSYKWFQLRGGVALASDGETIRVVGALSDIALRKRAESTMKSMNEKLDRRVRERTKALEQVNKELEAFSYSVSHDLRAPLRALDGFSQLLVEDYSDVLDEVGLDFLTRIRKAAQTMGSLIDDILRLSRVSRLEVKNSKVNLSKLASKIAAAQASYAPERKIEWQIQADVVVRGDPELLRILLENLIGNAVKYSLKREVAKIEFGSETSESGTRYFVRDNGAGFDQRYADKLFKAFQRLHTSSEYEGTGIGLATVARIVNKHGGSVAAYGELDKGAVFYFQLQNRDISDDD